MKGTLIKKINGRLWFDGKGKRRAIQIYDERETYLRCNGERGNKYLKIKDLCFSADSKRMAYWGYKKDQACLVVDGLETVSCNVPGSEEFLFRGAVIEGAFLQETADEEYEVHLFELGPDEN